MSRLSRAVASFQQQLLAKEQDVSTLLVQRYGTVYLSLSDELDKIAVQIVKLKSLGLDPTRDMLFRLTRLQSLLALTVSEVAEFSKYADAQVSLGQAFAIERAQESSKALIIEALGPIPESIQIPDNFLKFNARNVEAFIGRASNGSPLADLFATLTEEPVAAIENVFVKGIVRGENPLVVAKELKTSFNIPLTRAQTISRTEILNAQRQTAREYYSQNNRTVIRWRWQAAFNSRTCAMCLAMDGREFDTSILMGTHPNCRCAMVPVVRPLSELGINIKTKPRGPGQHGEEWFSKQDEKTQRAILGRDKLERYKDGKLTLRDTVGIKEDSDWGTSRWERSLRQIDAEEFAQTGADWGIMQGK